eukprot:3940745-Rhodomonas_salina.22
MSGTDLAYRACARPWYAVLTYWRTAVLGCGRQQLYWHGQTGTRGDLFSYLLTRVLRDARYSHTDARYC